jgi:MFS family permease
MAEAAAGTKVGVGRNVVVLAGVSLLTDVASEMCYPLLPIFLTVVLGASATALGAIEGVAESVASLTKLWSGRRSDRVGERKPLVVAGYSLASAAKPLIGLAGSAGQVLAVRVIDRAGKGLRQPPRDALIADSVPAAIRGRAFGLHRTGDNIGAVLGPLAAFALLRYGAAAGIGMRQVFLLAAIPAALSVALLVWGVREPGRREPARQAPAAAAGAGVGEGSGAAVGAPRAAAVSPAAAARLGGRFWAFLAVLAVFTLGNSSDAFLLLRATRVGVPTAWVPVLWAMLNLVKATFNVPGGALSDRWGRRPLLAAGWAIYAAVYLGFACAGAAWQIWVLFAVYGLYFGATEGVMSALVADFAPPARRGTAFGLYNLALGVGALPASLLFGLIADRAGAGAAFACGGALALAAAVAICFVAPSAAARRPAA